MNHDDYYSDVDSEGFVEDMRKYGVGQALPLDVCPELLRNCVFESKVSRQGSCISWIC